MDVPRGFSVDLSGTLAVVIGGNQGIGEAIALALGAAGARLVIAARDPGRLDAARRRLEAGGAASVEGRELDVTNADAISAFAEDVVTRHGVPEILVNSAGGALHKDAFDVTADEWDQLTDTHVRGTFFTCQAFGRHMAERGSGSIINLSSTWASTTAPGRSVYCTAKAGVGHMTAALATEWAPLGIRVNAIAPTSTRTPRVIERIAREPQSASFAVDRIPLGRLAEPDDVAGAALFLSSAASDFVTGHTLYVDGGWRASK